MSFRDVEVKMEYRTLLDNMAREFYVPLLRESVSYKRAVGFFSSSVLIEISKGILGLVKNGGKIKLITSPNLSEEDFLAIKKGYADRDSIIHDALVRELTDAKNKYQSDRLNLLANLIADGFLDIRIAITSKDSVIGIYHEKVGIIEDKEGNKIAFSGSANETANALMENYETVDVFCGWTKDSERVNAKEAAFDRIWNSDEPNLEIIEAQKLSDEIVRKYKHNKVNYQTFDDSNDVLNEVERECDFFKIPDYVDLYDYQKNAIDSWVKHSFCGIFDMATGTGKTYTALASVSKLSQMLDEKLAVIIVVPYKHLVEQWVEDIKEFNVNPIKAYGYSGSNWRNEFSNAVTAYNIQSIDHFCIITTNATFGGEDFQSILQKFHRNFCFIADEAHNLGAEKIGQKLPKKARYRLALSATLERAGDLKGTELLYNYFGETCIKFSLKEAIKRGFLTRYYYHPILVFLNKDELDHYNELTEKIIAAGYSGGEEVEKGSYLELLLIQRARIVAGCHEKVKKLVGAIKPYQREGHILVYCGATKYDRDDIDDLSDERQIDAVNNRLYNELGMRVCKFTSEENDERRKEIKRLFSAGDIQVVTAIKCLDEGVNIPSINKAFILASSTNPKEYIQRRGRVLRKSGGKTYAEIFDFITLPRPLEDVTYIDSNTRKHDIAMVKREFVRMREFAEDAENPMDAEEIKQDILNTYSEMG